jgi:tetratricopeptide (TPR) repeat protein
MILQDYQLNFSREGVETYTHAMVRVQTPQGLASVGTLALPWKPDSDVLTVHYLHILRGDQVVDVLGGGQTFTVLRRENNLEYAALDGVLTATVQPSGLQVGDIIDLAYTIKRLDPVLAGTVEQVLGGWQDISLAHLRVRAQWPSSMPVRWKSTDALGAPKEARRGDMTEVSVVLDHLEPLTQPEGAPLRFRVLRQIEFSDFKSWAEVSARLAPLYEKASILAADSPLHAEIAKIKKQSENPITRAEGALALVQDQVRYVYLGMNDGALVPAGADVTWIRRFGDCKAKTALLMAVLKELDIQAEPVAVNTVLGDGLDANLPMVGAFNHVLVRAQIAGQTYWLDGSRTGDRHLAALVIPTYRWGLPLAREGTELVQIVAHPLDQPLSSTNIRIDATSGIYAPAPFHAEVLLGGDVGNVLRLQLANLSVSDLDRTLRIYWQKAYSFVDPTSVAATFDQQTGYERLTVDGVAHMDWGGNRYETDGLDVGYNADFKRQAAINHDAPYAVKFPTYSSVKETILLPYGETQFTVEGKDVDRVVAGIEYHRHARLEKGVFEAQSTGRSIVTEFPYSEADSAQKTLREMTKDTIYIRVASRYINTDKDLAAAQAKEPDSADAFVNRANMFLDRGKYQEAIKDCDRAIAIDPKDDIAWADRGMANVSLHHDDLAKKDFARASALNPRNAVIFRGGGLMALNAKHYAEAIDAFTKSLELQPENPFALLRRAEAYSSSGMDNKALEDYSEAIKLQPGVIPAYTAKAKILLCQGKKAEASALADALIASNPGNASAQSAARYIHDEANRSVETSNPSLRSFAGVTVGMTTAELLKAKGTPIKREEPIRWFYNSIDEAHSGVIEVDFKGNCTEQSGEVAAILFYGENNAAPPGLPHLRGLTRDELVRQFGEPTWEPPPISSREYYIGFRNGILVEIVSGKTTGYGVYAPP